MKTESITRENAKRPLVWLRVLIITATLAAVAITIFLGNRTFRETRRLATKQFNQQQLILAQSAARGIESYFKELSVGLQSMARMPQFQQMDPECMRCMEHVYWGFPPRTSLRLLDKDGVLRLIYPNHNWRKELIGRNYSKEVLFQDAAKDGRVGVHVVANERGEDRIRVAVAIYSTPGTEAIKGAGVTTTRHSPIKPDPDRFCGVLVGSIDPGTIDRNLIRPIVSGKTGYAWLLDDRSVFLSHYEKDFVGQSAFEVRVEKNPEISYNAINQVQRKMLAGQEGVGRYFAGRHRGKEGQIEKLIAYTPVRIDNKVWSVAVCAPVSEVEEVIRASERSELYTLGFVILVLVAGGVLLLAVSRRWLHRLEHQVQIRTGELKETSDYLSRLIRYANAPIIVWDPNGKITIFNKAFEKMSGKGEAEVLGEPLEVLFPPESRSKSLDKIKSASGGQQWENVEIPILHKDGRVHIGLWNSANIYADDGQTLIATVAQGWDITERKQAEEALRESEDKLRTILDNMPDVVLQLDTNLTILWANKATLEMKPDAIGQLCYKALPGRNDLCPNCPIVKALKTGQIERGIVHLQSVAGVGESYWDDVGVPIKDAHGKIISIVKIARNITDIKLAEKEKTHLEDQLRQAVKMEAIGRLAGGIAHDFNNMLAIIQGYADLLLKDMDADDRNRNDVERIRIASKRAAALTRQLLAFGRRQPIKPEVLDLNEIISDTDSMLQRIIGEDIELVTKPGEDLWHVKVDPRQIEEQVVLNLAVNAREAMPEGGKITISTSNIVLDEDYARRHVETTPGEYVMLVVSDTGTGMTEEIMPHVFEPFFSTKQTGKSSGLGLSTIYGIVKQSGGHIEVESTPGQGSTFRMYLPRAKKPIKSTTGEAEPDQSEQGTETILVAEDEPSVRDLLCRILREDGYTVLVAADGKEAINAATNEGEIHLLVTDVVMPHMSGKELSDRIQAEHPNIKVLFVSGYTDSAISHHGVLNKGVNFLAKPFTSAQLIKTVRRILDTK